MAAETPQEKEDMREWYLLRSAVCLVLHHFLSAALSLVRWSQRASVSQGLDGVTCTGQEVRGHILSRQDVSVEHRVSVALLT